MTHTEVQLLIRYTRDGEYELVLQGTVLGSDRRSRRVTGQVCHLGATSMEEAIRNAAAKLRSLLDP
jgi:hypothetical protein